MCLKRKDGTGSIESVATENDIVNVRGAEVQRGIGGDTTTMVGGRVTEIEIDIGTVIQTEGMIDTTTGTDTVDEP